MKFSNAPMGSGRKYREFKEIETSQKKKKSAEIHS